MSEGFRANETPSSEAKVGVGRWTRARAVVVVELLLELAHEVPLLVEVDLGGHGGDLLLGPRACLGLDLLGPALLLLREGGGRDLLLLALALDVLAERGRLVHALPGGELGLGLDLLLALEALGLAVLLGLGLGLRGVPEVVLVGVVGRAAVLVGGGPVRAEAVQLEVLVVVVLVVVAVVVPEGEEGLAPAGGGPVADRRLLLLRGGRGRLGRRRGSLGLLGLPLLFGFLRFDVLPNKVEQPPLRPIVELVDVEVDLVVVVVDEVRLPYDLHDVR
mmetsp:Transcript_4854/g.10940  ORF Transcript_4854/g.10940 Transcript_4854/m.10940 type:complete len:275 (-) Transcript_4854:1051-1875(-)